MHVSIYLSHIKIFLFQCNFLDGVTSLGNNTLDPAAITNLLDDIKDITVNTELTNLNLTSTMVFLDFINANLNRTIVLTHLESLGLTECVSQVNHLFTQQSKLLNGDMLGSLQKEISSFYVSYETFMNSSFLPLSLKGGNENFICRSSLESFLTMMNNLTLITTFTETINFPEKVLSLKDKFLSLLPVNDNDAVGNCNWPLKYSIWKIPNNGIIHCNNVTGSLTGNVPDVFDSLQETLLTNLLSTINSISGLLSTNNVLDECTINGLKDAASTCNNDTNVVLTDALNLLSITLASVNNLDASTIVALKSNLNTAVNGNLSFSKYQLAEDFVKIRSNMTKVLANLKTVQTLMKKLNLVMHGNVLNMVPKLYSNLDAFKLIPLDLEDLNSLKLFPILTNGSGEESLANGLSDLVSGVSDTLTNLETDLTSVIDDLGDALNQLIKNLNNYLLDVSADDTFYRYIQ